MITNSVSSGVPLILATDEAAASGSTIAWFLVAAAVLIALNAFYVAYEFAILAAKRSTFESSRHADTRTSRAVLGAMSDLSMQLAGAQLGITMASLALGYVGEPAFEVLIERVLGTTLAPELTTGIAIVLSLAIVVFLHLVLGEMVPKNIALAAPDSTMRWLVMPYRFYLMLFRPFVVALNAIANAGVRLFGVEPRNELVAVHSASELAAIVNHSSEEGVIEADDAQLLTGALEFAQRSVGEVATPLDEFPTLRLGSTVAQAERVIASSGQERIPIARSSGEHLPFIGYVHARDLLGISTGRRSSPIPTDLVRNMAVVREDRSLVEVLRTLRRVRRQLALVMGENNEAVGIISVEDVVRALIKPTDAATGNETVAAANGLSGDGSGRDTDESSSDVAETHTRGL